MSLGRRSAGQRVARRHGHRHRADRSAARGRSQGLRVDRRSRRAAARRTAAGRRRPRRDSADGPRARRARSAQSRVCRRRPPHAPSQGTGVAARVDHRRRARAEQLSGSRASLQMERRTVPGEDAALRRRGRTRFLHGCATRIREFQAPARRRVGRAPIDLDAGTRAAARSCAARKARDAGADAACPSGPTPRFSAGAGIPSVLFGPGGAGLHSVEEYVNVEERVPRAGMCSRSWRDQVFEAGMVQAQGGLRTAALSNPLGAGSAGLSRASSRSEHEPDVGRPLAEATHEVRKPLPAERHVDAQRVALGDQRASAGRGGCRRASGTRTGPGDASFGARSSCASIIAGSCVAMAG